MATSPSASRRQRHRASTSQGSSIQGRHARSSVVLSTTSFSSNNDARSPSTFPISSSSMQPSSNPLLQPDVTPSSLLAQYTPQQLTAHLDALREDLKGYEVEMKRLINSRYGDILSVGGTISAMKGSSVHLHDKLLQVGHGLMKPSGASARRLESGNVKSTPGDEEEERVRNLAALLTIQQEAPEEIWTTLDSVSTSLHQLPSSSSNSDRLATLLKCARSLSSAISLYDAVRLAGWEIDGMDDHERIQKLFPHPLETRSTTLSAIKGEMRLALEQIVELATVGHRKQDSTPATQEALFRTTALALLGLVRLNILQPSAVGEWYLARRRARLEGTIESLHQSAHERSGEGQRALAKVMRELAETISVHSRLLSFNQGSSFTLLQSLLRRMMSSDSKEAEPSASSSQSADHAALLPPSPLASLSALSNASHVLASLDQNSGLRGWTPFFELSDTAESSKTQSGELSAWVESMLANELKADGGLWARELVLEQPALGTLTAISKARSRLGRQIATHQSPQGESGRLTKAVHQHLEELLSGQAVKLATEEIAKWRNEVVKELQLLTEAPKHQRGDTGLYEDLFFPTSPAAGASLSRSESSSTLQGSTAALTPFTAALRDQWDAYQDVKETYFDYCYEDEEVETPQEEHERSVWSRVEREGWTRLFEEGEKVVAHFAGTPAARGRDADAAATEAGQETDTGRAVQLVSQAVLQLAHHPLPDFSSPFESEEDRKQYAGLVKHLRVSRDRLLEACWKPHIVAQAGGLLLRSDDGHDGSRASASGGTADEKVRPSGRLLRALYYLDVEAGKILLLSRSKTSQAAATATATQDQPVSVSGATEVEVGSMPDLLASLLIWLRSQSEQDKSLRSRLERGDVDILAALLRSTATATVDVEVDAEARNATQEALLATASLRSQLPLSPHEARSSSTRGEDSSSSSEANLLESLAPYALLFGRMRVRSAALPSPAAVQQQQRISASSAPAPLFEIAPVKARIRGVEVR